MLSCSTRLPVQMWEAPLEECSLTRAHQAAAEKGARGTVHGTRGHTGGLAGGPGSRARPRFEGAGPAVGRSFSLSRVWHLTSPSLGTWCLGPHTSHCMNKKTRVSCAPRKPGSTSSKEKLDPDIVTLYFRIKLESCLQTGNVPTGRASPSAGCGQQEGAPSMSSDPDAPRMGVPSPGSLSWASCPPARTCAHTGTYVCTHARAHVHNTRRRVQRPRPQSCRHALHSTPPENPGSSVSRQIPPLSNPRRQGPGGKGTEQDPGGTKTGGPQMRQ